MIDCQQVTDSLFEYLNKELSAQNLASVKAHLELCRHCFDRVEFEEILRTKLREKTDHTCPEVVKKRIERLMKEF